MRGVREVGRSVRVSIGTERDIGQGRILSRMEEMDVGTGRVRRRVQRRRGREGGGHDESYRRRVVLRRRGVGYDVAVLESAEGDARRDDHVRVRGAPVRIRRESGEEGEVQVGSRHVSVRVPQDAGRGEGYRAVFELRPGDDGSSSGDDAATGRYDGGEAQRHEEGEFARRRHAVRVHWQGKRAQYWRTEVAFYCQIFFFPACL
mmetsp:Transcript_7880/g.23293  ORF Transcript_7880/g.23293 Transcript_7880/m.23293 type:complete len:204 (+) Transcript_7880:727-1338(+)